MPADSRDPNDYLPLTRALFHVLLSLTDGEKHGYAIVKEIEERTNGTVRLSTGTLYGIVKRLLQDGWIIRGGRARSRRRRAAGGICPCAPRARVDPIITLRME